MSRNILAAGHDLTVCDIRPEAVAGLVADGADIRSILLATPCRDQG